MQLEYSSGRRDKYSTTKAANDKTRERVKRLGYVIAPENRLYGDDNPAKRLDVRKKNSDSKLGDKNPMRKYAWVRKIVGDKTKKRFETNPESHPNRVMARKGYRTYIERVIKRVLEKDFNMIEGKDFFYDYKVLNYYIDWALPQYRIAIECDGERWHTDKEADLVRQNNIEGEDWTVIRFTGNQIAKHTNDCSMALSKLLPAVQVSRDAL